MRKDDQKKPEGLEKFLKRDPRLRFRLDKEHGVIGYLRGDLAKIATVGGETTSHCRTALAEGEL